MPSRLRVCAFLITLLTIIQPVFADDAAELSWIWSKDSTSTIPAGKRWFRKTFTIDRPIANPVDLAVIEATADDEFTLWFNGVKIGSGTTWRQMNRFNVKAHAKHGNNVIAIEANNTAAGSAGLLVRAEVIPNGKSTMSIVTDSSWKCSTAEPAANWTQADFNDTAWQSTAVVGKYGSKPWGIITWENGPTSSRFTVPSGFSVETVIPPQPKTIGLDPKLPFSLVNMTFDNKGRLLVSQERGPVLLCTEPNAAGEMQKIKPYCKLIKNAHGLCWVRDALLIVGDGPQGTGLYRAKDTNGDDEADAVQLIHKFKGGMGEHGPHAIIHGPDDWLYLVIGNHAWAQPKQLATNSPLLRWPTGHFGPDQDKPNTTEDVLLPRLNDGRGHAANILAPGGTIWRMDHEGNNMSLVAAGFRNHFDAAFRSTDGELFTFDSDMEWDESLPWYRPVRFCHVPMGADFVWRTGAANTPNYYIDSLPPMVETGRGSPCGVAVYEHVKYPQKYRGSIFLADWSIGVIWAVHTKPDGATFKGEAEKFCIGSPLNVTDLEVGPDGFLYFTLGGRGSAGGLYRIRYTGPLTREFTPPDRIQPLAAWSKGRDLKTASASLATNDLKSNDAMKQRRACEEIIRNNITVKADDLWPLLQSEDAYLRTAARLVLQRIDPTSWINELGKLPDLAAMEAIVALCKTHQADKHTAAILARLIKVEPSSNMMRQLQLARTWQLTCIHAGLTGKESEVASVIKQWFTAFPSSDDRLNRELAILLVHAHRQGWTDLNVPEKLLVELNKTGTDRQQQIHYAYCARLLRNGWSPAMKQSMLAWFEKTKNWTGGHSFTPFMENIFKDWAKTLDANEKLAVFENLEKNIFAASILLRDKSIQLPQEQLVGLIDKLASSKEASLKSLCESVIDSLGKDVSKPEVQNTLRRIADRHSEMFEPVLRTLVKSPSPENGSYYVQGLRTSSVVLLKELVNALKKSKYTPKAEDAEAYRLAILAINKLNERDRLSMLQLLQQWKPQRFSPEGNDLSVELTGWSRWYTQQFPKATALPSVAAMTASSKWKMQELKQYLEQDPKGKTGDIARGKLVFAKANCIKCHKFGSEGEGLGPDLTTLKSRFQRVDTLEAILDPSKVISDQYRGTVLVTQNGQTISGLAAPQGDTVTVLQADGTKVTLKKSEIESQVASTVSPMPEKLLDDLTLQEIADLFAYLESTPKP